MAPDAPAATQALKTFFSCPRFAVAGASSDPAKFGNRIFSWYLAHSLPVTPLNPRAAAITAANATHATLPSPAALPAPADTALSVVTPPKATLALLREAKAAGVRAVWLQPGTWDSEVEAFVLGEGEADADADADAEEAVGDGTATATATAEAGAAKTQNKEPFAAALFGHRWGGGGHEGWCVLVDGEDGLRAAARDASKGRI